MTKTSITLEHELGALPDVKDLEIETQETQKPLRPIKRHQSNLPMSHSRAKLAHRLLYHRDFASIPPNLRKSQAATFQKKDTFEESKQSKGRQNSL